MKRKSKQASKALQHYYVHSVSGEEREPVSWWRKGCETKTPVKPEPFLARGYTRTIADHRETGGGGGGDASPDKEDNHIEQSSMVARTSHTNTHSQTREPFSHTDLALSHKLPSDRLCYLLPPRSHPPSSSSYIWYLSLSTLNCKSDLSKALGYLHTPATAPFIPSHWHNDICINVVPVVLCHTGMLCGGIFSTRKQPWLLEIPPCQTRTLIKSHIRTHKHR